MQVCGLLTEYQSAHSLTTVKSFMTIREEVLGIAPVVSLPRKAFGDGREAKKPPPQNWDCEMTITGKIKGNGGGRGGGDSGEPPSKSHHWLSERGSI